MNKKIGILHVPKTGGSYLKNILNTNNIEYIYEGHKTEYIKKENTIYIGFVRNPWMHVISMYHHAGIGFCETQKYFESFRDAVMKGYFNFLNKYEQIYKDNKINVDIIFKTEHMSEAITIIEDIIGKKIMINNVEGNITPNKPDMSIYDEEMDEKIREGYKSELNVFKYDKKGDTTEDKMFFYDRNGEVIKKEKFYELWGLTS